MGKTTRLYLVRHGRTRWNEENRYQGSSDCPLNETGIRQSRMLTARLRNTKIDVFYSSPSQRAVETIQELACMKKKCIQTDIRLQEIDFGDWEGKTDEELKKVYIRFPDFLQRPDEFSHPKEHMFYDVQKRVVACLDELLQRYEGSHILVASHTGSIRLAFMHYLQMSNHNLFIRMQLENTAISILELQEDGIHLISWNDSSHLQTICDMIE